MMPVEGFARRCAVYTGEPYFRESPRLVNITSAKYLEK
jgi:hypothetical protein